MCLRLLLFTLIVSLASGLTPGQWDNLWEKAEKKCEHLMKFGPSDKKSLLTEIDDIPKRAKCFVSCFFDEVGLTSGTEINHDLYMKWLDEELQHAKNKDDIVESVKSCIDGIEKTEKCSTAYQLYECFGKRYFNEN